MLDINELKHQSHWMHQLDAHMETHPWRYLTLERIPRDFEKIRPVGKSFETITRTNLSGTSLKPKIYEHPWKIITVSSKQRIVLQRPDGRIPARKFRYNYPFDQDMPWTSNQTDFYFNRAFKIRDYNSGNMDPVGFEWDRVWSDELSKNKKTPSGRRKIWLQALEEFLE